MDGNEIENGEVLDEIPSLTTITASKQNFTIEDKTEVELPNIFILSQSKNSKAYTSSKIEITNGELSENGSKVKVSDKNKDTIVKINGGIFDGSTLTIKNSIKANENNTSSNDTTEKTNGNASPNQNNDLTVSNKGLPYTGRISLILLALIISSFGVFGYIKYRKNNF